MQQTLSDAIFERFFRELAQDSGDSRRLSEELRRHYDETGLNRDGDLAQLYERLAEESA
jgi:nicotinic acid phosphoribosyltransferase